MHKYAQQATEGRGVLNKSKQMHKNSYVFRTSQIDKKKPTKSIIPEF